MCGTFFFSMILRVYWSFGFNTLKSIFWRKKNNTKFYTEKKKECKVTPQKFLWYLCKSPAPLCTSPLEYILYTCVYFIAFANMYVYICIILILLLLTFVCWNFIIKLCIIIFALRFLLEHANIKYFCFLASLWLW